ncbi:rCG43067 [Rattus norvegicus]|uniref:RCG43067 n=1 Tax=Rattus norvegicus TaxID=10116 RepID=A6IVU1_RAT|nr:rCG43067 [Rattus norvegicus]
MQAPEENLSCTSYCLSSSLIFAFCLELFFLILRLFIMSKFPTTSTRLRLSQVNSAHSNCSLGQSLMHCTHPFLTGLVLYSACYSCLSNQEKGGSEFRCSPEHLSHCHCEFF